MSAGGDISIIGQVGVGLYSAYFFVSKKILVVNKTNDDKQHIYLSSCRKTRRRSMERSKIIFHINEDQSDFREDRRLKDLVKKHSGSTGLPMSCTLRNQRRRRSLIPRKTRRKRKTREAKRAMNRRSRKSPKKRRKKRRKRKRRRRKRCPTSGGNSTRTNFSG